MGIMARLRNAEAALGTLADEGVATAHVALVLDGNKSATGIGSLSGTKWIGDVVSPLAAPAAAGSVLGNATVVTSGINAVTGADDTKGIKLPTAAGSAPVVVINTVANKILKVWPFDGNQTINAIAAGGNLSMGNGTTCILVPTGNTSWATIPRVPS